MKKRDFVDVLHGVWLFSGCTKKELNAIASLTTQIDVPAGKVLATQGQPGREFFVIVTGKAEATRGEIPIGLLGPGTFFGEMSLLEHKPRVATVTTTEPTTALVLTAQEFDRLVAMMPSVDRRMLTVVADRLRELEERYVPVDERVVSKDIA
jgi:CRP-like cAMP-binding protein